MADPLAETSQLLRTVPYPPSTGTSRAGALEHQKTEEAEPKNSLTSPIDIIPPEVICYILNFTLALPVATASSPTIPVLGVHSPPEPWVLSGAWVLGQVCREWRALAIAFPVLWTSMVVADNIRPRERHLLDIQLERSGNAPLDLLIRTRFGRNFGRKTPFDGFMPKLVGYCGRWRSLHLQFDGPCPLHWAFDRLGPLPLLRELILSGATDVATLDAFKDAPNLRKVALSNPGQTSIHDTPLPWAQLATYKATYPDGSKHFRNLSMACNLVECDLDFGTQTTDQLVRHMGTLTLPQLRRLVITKDLFLDCLVAPALNELQVHGTIDRVLPFLRRSACILARLTLFRCNAGTDTEILQILRNTPSLNHLALDFRGPSSSTSGLISAFMMSPGGADGASVCPNLTSLFWGDRNDTMDRSAFVDMVESRWRTSDPTHRGLHFVRVYLGRLRMRSRRLQMFAEEGLDVIAINSRKGNRAMELWREY
ncbi:hypothetical protein B0H11DRAFT_1953682 [Mycena galericulata]|nr:hypothetical protein B0H11DRAFT_1953682 [Mycena galericulata]